LFVGLRQIDHDLDADVAAGLVDPQIVALEQTSRPAGV